MNSRPDLDTTLRAWLEQAAATEYPPDYLDEVLDRTRRMRQRPTWTFAGRGLPQLQLGTPLRLTATAWLLLLLALALALLGGVLALNNVRHLPAPYGFARPGLIAIDIDDHLWLMKADGSDRHLITNGSPVDVSPAWSPDGTLLAFWRATGNGHWTIVIVDESGTVRASIVVPPATRLPLPPNDPALSALGYARGTPSPIAWSPDSRRLAFSGFAPGSTTGPRIWVVGADGRGLRHVGDPNLPAADPVWSSDGSQIAFAGGADAVGGDAGVYVMGADGSDVRRVSKETVGGAAFAPFTAVQWQPGGELIAFFAGVSDQAHLFVVRSDGTGERDLTGATAEPGTVDWLPRWSPDGTRLAYAHHDNAHPNDEIRIMNADGSGKVTLARQEDVNTSGAMWSPDARSIEVLLYHLDGTIDLMSLDVTGGHSPTLTPINGNQGDPSWQRLAP